METPEELERRRRVVAAGLTDFVRWSDPSNFPSHWDSRAEAAGRLIPAGSSVLDLGCGSMALERYLPEGAIYYPSDICSRDERTLICNVDLEPLPEIPGLQVVCALGLNEYLNDINGFYCRVRERNARFVTSYHPLLDHKQIDRPSMGWMNSLTFPEWIAIIENARFELQELKLVSPGQYLVACAPI